MDGGLRNPGGVITKADKPTIFLKRIKENIMDKVVSLLKELTEIPGVPGYEEPVRNVVKKYLAPYGEIETDKMGSLICKVDGSHDSPRVMLAGHMDEIGFMVRYINKEGFIHFVPVGGWFDQVLLGQRVTILTSSGEVTGVIGVKPPHLLSPEEREKVIKRKEMYIDIGAIKPGRGESLVFV